MCRHAGFFNFGRVCARTVQEGSTSAAGAIDDFFGQGLKVIAVVVISFANDVDETSPSASQADDLAALAYGTESDGPDSRVQTGHIAASGEDSDDPFFCVHIRHFCAVLEIKKRESHLCFCGCCAS